MEEKIVYDKEYGREFIDIETGEIKTLGQLTFDDYERRKQSEEEMLGNKKLTDKQIEGLKKRKSKDLLHQALDFYCGSYYFNNYEKLIKKLDDGDLFRFVYLCAFMDYENRVKIGQGSNSFMTINDFQKTLGLGKSESYNTRNELINSGTLLSKNDIIYINKKYCIKGKMPKSFKGGCIRMFDEAIKYLYDNAKPKEHKKLGLLIKILPYINKQHNVVCTNPLEEDISLIEAVSIPALCDIIGYSRSNASKLRKDLLALRFSDKLVAMINETDNGKFLTINPSVYYGGNDIDKLEAIINLFNIKNIK